MTGQASIAIDGYSWAVSVASTPTELTAGLSGVASIPVGSGMLFDMGRDQSYIAINMSGMLFALDIVFINSTAGVVGVLRNVQPGAEDAWFEASLSLGARYFLEMNAGEAEGISVGDNVVMTGVGVGVSTLGQLMASMMTMGLIIPVIAGAMGIATGVGIAGLREPPEKNAGKWKF